MPRLIFVHGINQNGKEPNALRDEWRDDLVAAMSSPDVLDAIEIHMPFYGDALVEAAGLGSAAIAQGVNENEDRELAEFLIGGLEEQAFAAGFDRSDIITAQEENQQSEAVPMDFPMDRRLNAVVSVLEKISPWRGDIAVRALSQAHAYLKKPRVRQAVDDIVAAVFLPEPRVIVAHSLGTIVSFALLRKLAQTPECVQVPLLVTLGSPLPLSTVQRAIEPPFNNPLGVARWINVRDPDDFISLNRGLNTPRFPGPIENFGDFDNPGEDAHAIPGYLRHRPTVEAIKLALQSRT